MNLHYDSGIDARENPVPDFDIWPDFIQTWYDDWRANQKRGKRRQTIEKLQRYEGTLKEEKPPEQQERSAAGRALVQARWGKR